MVVSSANMYTDPDTTDVGKSFVNIEKSVGPKTDPCGMPYDTGSIPSSETQGQLVGAGKRLNGRGKKLGEEKSRKKVGAPGILLLTDQFRNHLKSLPVIGHKNIFCAQSESSSFRVTFVTSYSTVFTAKLFARLFAIYLLARAGEFPSIEKCH